MRIENCAATIQYSDVDDYDINNINIKIHEGWEFFGETGWINDCGWNEVAWEEIDPKLAHLNNETCVDDVPELPADYLTMSISHSDKNSKNAGTSETKAWWVTYIFKRR